MLTRTAHDQLTRDLNRLFDSIAPAAPLAPPINIREHDDTLVINAVVPGVAAEDLELDVATDTVEIRITRDQNDDEQLVRQERPRTSALRTINLPNEVDPDRAEAALDRGILTITLYQATPQRRRIDVSTSTENRS